MKCYFFVIIAKSQITAYIYSNNHHTITACQNKFRSEYVCVYVSIRPTSDGQQ